MIFAHDVAAEFAMALCFISRNKKIEERIRMCVVLRWFDVSDMDCICFV